MARPVTPLKTGLPLWLEITAILIVKLGLLWGAKQLWFSKPLTHTHEMSVSQVDIHQQLLGTSASLPATTSTPSFGEPQ